MPAASYVSTPIERSLAFSKNASSPGSYLNSKFANVDHTAHSILSANLDFIKYDKPSVKIDIKSKYHTLSANDINANINSICSTYSKTKLSLNNVSSSVSNDRKALFKDASSSSGKCLSPKPKEVLYSPSKITLGWQGRVPVGAGLVNAINTCYLNSCLQALFHIPSFHNWLLNDPEHTTLCEKQGGSQFECLVCAMRKTLAHCQSKSGGTVRPELIIKKLKLIARHLEHHRQEDSHEFLNYLIEGMQKCYLKAIPGANKLDSYSKETTPLYQIFGSYLRTEVTCSACRAVSTSYTHSTELSLDIRQASNLDDALSHFFAKETLSGENAYSCESCGRKVEAVKRFRLEAPPNVLRLQLKRFNYHGFKNSRSVLVPSVLDFGKFMQPTPSLRPSSSTLKYKLVSAIIHHGSSPDSGHYTCIGSTSSGTYHYFDDEMVRPSNLQQLTNAYVVLYELLPSSAASLHASSSPGLAASSSSSAPRKMIGPLLPPSQKPNNSPNIISSAVNTNVDISFLTKNSNNSPAKTNDSNGSFSGSKLVNGSFSGSKLVNGSFSGSKLVNGSSSSPVKGFEKPNGFAAARHLKSSVYTPTKLPSPSFLKSSTDGGDARKSSGLANGSSGGNLAEQRRSMPELTGSGAALAESSKNGGSSVENSAKAGFNTKSSSDVKWDGVNGKVNSGSPCASSPVKAVKNGVASGRESPSSHRNGLKRTAKLVDYESDDDESNPDDSSQSDRKSKKSKAGPALNGWKVLGSGDETGGSVGTMMSRGAASASGMEWSVVPVTPPANKSANTSLDSSSISTSGPSPPVQSSSRPSPSPVPSPSPSRASSPSSISSGRSGNYFASSLSTAGTGSSGSGGVSEYLNRRTMSGENSYGSNNVTSWDNEPSSLVQNGSSQPLNRFPRYNADREDDEEDMDRGRVKKVKSQHNNKYQNNNYHHNKNPFSHYQQQNNNRKSYNNGDRHHYYSKYSNYNNNTNKHRHNYNRHQPYYRRY